MINTNKIFTCKNNCFCGDFCVVFEGRVNSYSHHIIRSYNKYIALNLHNGRVKKMDFSISRGGGSASEGLKNHFKIQRMQGSETKDECHF